MALTFRQLGADERVVLRMRTHAKAMFWPAAGFVVAAGLLGAGAALIPSGYRPWGQLGVALLALVLMTWWTFLPFLRWRTSTFTFTNRRLIAREGILSRSGRELALDRVSEVAYDQGVADRLLGCGTLRLATAADGGVISLPDVPDVEHVQAVVAELLFSARGR